LDKFPMPGPTPGRNSLRFAFVLRCVERHEEQTDVYSPRCHNTGLFGRPFGNLIVFVSSRFEQEEIIGSIVEKRSPSAVGCCFPGFGVEVLVNCLSITLLPGADTKFLVSEHSKQGKG
jgi:hypothetical protein